MRNDGLPVIEASCPFNSQVTWNVIQFDTARLREQHWTPEKLRKHVGDLIYGQKCGFTTHRIILVGDDIDVFSDADCSMYNNLDILIHSVGIRDTLQTRR